MVQVRLIYVAHIISPGDAACSLPSFAPDNKNREGVSGMYQQGRSIGHSQIQRPRFRVKPGKFLRRRPRGYFPRLIHYLRPAKPG
jgi:hypothetical protein